jgi:GNAT superfamily N-acetyltransferase
MNLKIDSKPKTDFVLRPIGEDDVPAITSLYKLCFEDKPTEKFIRWRYLRKRVGTPTILAFKGSTCVASYAVWLTPLTLNEEEVLGAVGIDAMTHPDFRGHGLFVQLANKCYDLISQHGCKVLYGFAGDNSLPVGARRLNWDHLCDIPRWTRPLWILGTSPLSGLVAATSLLWSSTSAKQLRLAAEAPRAEDDSCTRRAP